MVNIFYMYLKMTILVTQLILLTNKQAETFKFCDWTQIKQLGIQKVIVKQC